MNRIVALFTVSALLIALLFIQSIQPTLAQGPTEVDPLAGNRTLSRSSEIMIAWSERDEGAGANNKQIIYDFLAGGNPPPPANTTVQPASTKHSEGGPYGNKHLDIASGDFNNTGGDDVIVAWEGPNDTIQMLLPPMFPNKLDWGNGVQLFTSNGPLVATNGQAEMRQIHLATGDFDGDGQDEFVLAYQGSDEKVHLEVYDTDGTFTPQLKGSKNDMPIPGPNESEFAKFDVAAGDLDGDGDDEIVLVGFTTSSATIVPVFVKVYEYDPTQPADPIKPKDLTETFITVDPETTSSPGGVVGAVAVATGDFDGKDLDDEIAVSFYYKLGDQLNGASADSYLYLLQASSDIETLTVYEDQRVTRKAGDPNYPTPLDVTAGDMNKDGRDEIAFAAGSQVRVYESNDNFELTDRGGVSYFVGRESYLYSQNFIALQDMNSDIAAELVVAVNNYFIDDAIQNTYTQKHDIDVYQANLDANNAILSINNLVGTKQGETITKTKFNELRHQALVVADFDGDGVRVGEPLHFVETEILQPLVILNSPPVHFDVLGGEIKDVSKCFTGASNAGCQHSASYEEADSTQVQVQLEVHRDYGFSAQVGTSLADVVNVSIKATYGEGFSKVTNSTQTRTDTFTEEVFGEDRFYATLVDYDIWEYPLYNEGDSQPKGFIVIVIPGESINTWFSTKDKQANSYQQDHEVGNILSYPVVTNHPDVGEIIVDDQKRIMSGNSFQDWHVSFSDVSETVNGNSVNFGLEVGSQVSGLGLEVGVTGTYDQNTISTHSMTVEESFQMGVHLDTIDRSFGEDQYGVIRYAYWRTDGALILDYAVPTTDLVGSDPFNPTWWDDNYGHTSDPAFLLPWRYDPEKFNSPQSSLQQRTKDITFLPSEPAPGETVEIRARVHNYSLKPTSGPVKVAFYLDDPASGGTLLGEATTLNPLDIRGNETVKIDWPIPANYEFRYSRIFAVIDPDNQMSEIHETNNKGYVVLKLDCDSCLVADLSLTSNSITFEPETPAVGQPVTIKAAIQSDQTSTPDVGVSFYNGDPNSGGVLIGSDIVSDFGADGKAVAQIVWTPSASGSLDIWVVIEAQDGEPSSANNQAAQTMPVTPATIYLPLVIK